jgi:hypothetical protein
MGSSASGREGDRHLHEHRHHAAPRAGGGEFHLLHDVQGGAVDVRQAGAFQQPRELRRRASAEGIAFFSLNAPVLLPARR